MGYCFYCATVSDTVICSNCTICTVAGCDQKFKHGDRLWSLKGTEMERYCAYHGARITQEGGYCFTCAAENNEEAGHLSAGQVQKYKIYRNTHLTEVWGCVAHPPNHSECKNCDVWFVGTCRCSCVYCKGTNTVQRKVKCFKDRKGQSLETVTWDKYVCGSCTNSKSCESCQTVCLDTVLSKWQRKHVCVDCLECEVHGKNVVPKKFKQVEVYQPGLWGGFRKINVPVPESGFKCRTCDDEKRCYGRPLMNFHTKWPKEAEWRENNKFPSRIRKLDEYLEFAGEKRGQSSMSLQFAKRQRL
jgi:hypothetical protein